jgi:hypothetical protein
VSALTVSCTSFSLGATFASLSAISSIAHVSVPNTSAILMTADHIELIPIQIRDRNWDGHSPSIPGLAFAGWAPADEARYFVGGRAARAIFIESRFAA